MDGKVIDASIKYVSDFVGNPDHGDDVHEKENYDNHRRILSQHLFGDLVLSKRKKRMWVVADGLMRSLPVELLSWPSTKVSQTGKGESVIGDHLAVSYLYSISLFQDEIQLAEQPWLAVFAPDYNTSMLSAHRACVDDRYYRLKCNREEAVSIGEEMHAKLFLGAQASTASFHEEVADAVIIHLAGHACVDTQDYYQSALILSDGMVKNIDVYRLNLKDKVVVLSACNTARTSPDKDEVYNFARVFLERGCRAVVVSLWPVDDCSTVELMQSLYHNLSKGQSMAAALGLAKKTFRQNADNVHSHPFYWSSFIVIGNEVSFGTSRNMFIGLLVLAGLALLLWWKYNRRRP